MLLNSCNLQAYRLESHACDEEGCGWMAAMRKTMAEWHGRSHLMEEGKHSLHVYGMTPMV